LRQPFPPGFLWGAATSAHQAEGNNVNSDMWEVENRPHSPMPERSGDACDFLHRWPEDLDLAASLGLTAFRFSIEWARIEPEPGRVSRAMLQHYERIIAGCLERSITPVVTLHHFTCPRWFRSFGDWTGAEAPALFGRYVAAVAPILDGVEWVCTINEPNMLAIMHAALAGLNGPLDFSTGMPEPDPAVTAALVRAHQEARAALAGVGGVRSGWTVANLNAHGVGDGGAQLASEWGRLREDRYLAAAAEDDFVGVQVYTRTMIGPSGQVVPVGADVRQTLTGWEFYPAALGEAVRHTADVVPGVPILVTENGVATSDDAERVEYMRGALAGLARAIGDGIDVRGYLHWSFLDNYEWGSFRPTFGLVAVDRETFTRTPKPSARWLGGVAQANTAELDKQC